MNKKIEVTAIQCDTVEQLQNVMLKLHSKKYKHPNGSTMLNNVWLADAEFKRGMRFINLYSDSDKVKFAANDNGLNNGKNCQVVKSIEYLKK